MNAATHAAAAATLATALVAVPADGVIQAIPERRAAPDEKGGRRTQDAVPVVLAQGDDAPMPRLTAKQRKQAEAEARIRAEVTAANSTGTPPADPAPAQQSAAKMLDDVRQSETKTDAPLAVEQAGGYTGPMRGLRERLKAGAYTKMPNGQPANGDEVATLLGSLEPAEVIKACMAAMALETNPYAHLNVGQQSMNLRNKLRGQLKRNEIGMGVLREEVEDLLAARPAQPAPTSATQTPAPAPEAVPPAGAVAEPSKAADPISATERSEASKKANAARTPEQRSAAAKKGAATRAAKARK